MSKRKPKRNKRANRRAPDSSQSPSSTERSVEPKPALNQRLLLMGAMALLAFVAYLNIKRFRDSSLPEPLAIPKEMVAKPLAKPSVGTAGTRFTLLSPNETGVDFTHPVVPDHPMAFLYFSSTASGGTAVGDVNDDGRPDLFIASGPKKNRLYLQTDQPFDFRDISDQADIGGEDAWACGATMVDINADGRLDIYVANYDSPNAMYINLGNGKFKNMAWKYGLNITNASLEGTFADYDRDGFLDMYLVNYRYENPNGMPSAPPIVGQGENKTIHPDFKKYYELSNDSIGYTTIGRSDGLLRNLGTGEFQDVTAEAGIHGRFHGQSATWWDYNDDGFPDLHVGNDFNDPDNLYRNNGDGTFTDVIREAVPHTTWFSMGSDAGDIDGDALPDLLTSDMSSTTHFKQKTTMGSMGSNAEFLAKAIPRQYMRNALLVNSGTDRFKEAAYLANLESTDWTWSVKLADFDCDGMLDAFFTNGSVRSFTDSDRTLPLSQRQGKTEWDLYKDTEPLKEQNLAFRNAGSYQFENVSKDWGLNHLGVSMSAAHADFDGDGDLDLVVANLDEPLAIYRNDAAENKRLTIRLHGRGGNRFAIGAKVTVKLPGEQPELTRELYPSRGFLASNEPVLHFGLGDAETVSVTVRWPNGTSQSHSNIQAGNHYEIVEQADLQLAAPPKIKVETIFETKDAPKEFTHHESDFDDYQLQPLLPHRMSRLGPAIAAADFDGDNDIDYFIGGAAGEPGKLAIHEDGKLQLSKQPALAKDAATEDMGAVWLDIDNDGDQDLFVGSGGNEFAMDADEYLPRLYLNQDGVLERSTDRIPDIRVSAGPVSAADFDLDGDVDLFVGGRQVPGKYPLPARSYLLVNQDGKFTDQTNDLIPAAAKIGMVTGSLWSDVDNDNDLDLLLATEWGAIRLFRNEDNQFRDDTSLAGLSAFRGWWTGITAADVDADGDMDYIATNLGLNTKYHADDEHPFRIFFGDFESNGQPRLVEAEYEGSTLFPVRGKSCSTHAIPSLGDKFKTYKAFAAASLEDIYTTKCLDEAYECSANYLSSAILTNDGSGRFTIKPLPAEAQLAPTFGCIVSFLSDDEHPDIFLAQNFFSPQPETGNMDGGLGCVLSSTPERLLPFRTRDTGVLIPEDAKAVVLAELNGDGRPDLVVTTNNDSVRLITSTNKSERPDLETVRITFDAQSTSSIAGTRVEFLTDTMQPQLAEIAAGGGYLSQQPPLLFFKRLKAAEAKIRIRWNSGETQELGTKPGEKSILLTRKRPIGLK